MTSDINSAVIQQLEAKVAALTYAHRICVSEKRFRTLNDSAEKLFAFMIELAFELRAASHIKEIMYQYRNMATASVIFFLIFLFFKDHFFLF